MKKEEKLERKECFAVKPEKLKREKRKVKSPPGKEEIAKGEHQPPSD